MHHSQMPATRPTFFADPQASAFFAAQPAGYRQLITYWIVSAKRPETRQKRLDALIEGSEAGRRLR
jgi:uncharacterized protein YdeI (YjbR/CyaY-like superfamily)